MACVYDNEMFQKFRALAVTEVEKLVVGKTYYSNSYPTSFTVKEVITYGEHAKRNDLDHPCRDSDKMGWIVISSDPIQDISLADRNVTQSYNPWLIFETESLSTACRECVPVKIVNDGYDDHFDDWATEYLED